MQVMAAKEILLLVRWGSSTITKYRTAADMEDLQSASRFIYTSDDIASRRVKSLARQLWKLKAHRITCNFCAPGPCKTVMMD